MAVARGGGGRRRVERKRRTTPVLGRRSDDGSGEEERAGMGRRRCRGGRSGSGSGKDKEGGAAREEEGRYHVGRRRGSDAWERGWGRLGIRIRVWTRVLCNGKRVNICEV